MGVSLLLLLFNVLYAFYVRVGMSVFNLGVVGYTTPVHTSTMQTIYLKLREYHQRGGRKIVTVKDKIVPFIHDRKAATTKISIWYANMEKKWKKISQDTSPG